MAETRQGETKHMPDYDPNQGRNLSSRAKDYVELHEQVETSVKLLESLESFLSTFQQDLSAVSGQISDLQSRSKDIDNRLKSRRKIEKPLSSLLSNITVPPPLATLILDTDVGEPWIAAIIELEQRLEMIKGRARVKAARDLAEVTEGLRIVATTKIRAFFLALFQPIRASVSTNMQVIQTSVLLKYQPLFAFLQRQAAAVAQEVQRAYVGAARLYYETGFRRYARSLGYVKIRTTEILQPITVGAGEKKEEDGVDETRLTYARIDGPGVTLAYMADTKTHVEPIEALTRSLLLVLMDNSTAEYTFLSAFFSPAAPLVLPPSTTPARPAMPRSLSGLLSPTLFSPGGAESDAGSELDGVTPRPGMRARADSIFSAGGPIGLPPPSAGGKDNEKEEKAREKEEKAALDTAWKQIMDPVLEYCQAFIKSVLDPSPPVIPLLTIIRLTEDVMSEIQKRQPQCTPVENFVFGLRLQMWPVFQKGMGEHVESVKRLAEGGSGALGLGGAMGMGGLFGRMSGGMQLTDAAVVAICKRYIVMFTSFVTLTAQADETMIFSNLLRLRQELSKLVVKHTEKIADPARRATAQSSIYEALLQGLSRELRALSHPKAQSEIAHWREREEEARRRIVSSNQTRR